MGNPNFKLLRVTGRLTNNDQTLYRPVLISKGIITLSDIADFISDKSSLTRGDVFSGALLLADELHRWLREGNTVDLGPLGRFAQQVEAAVPITDPDRFYPGDVRFRRIAYDPDLAYRSTYAGMRYRRDHSEEQLTGRSDAELATEVLALRRQYRLIHVELVRKALQVGYDRAMAIVKGLVADGRLQQLTLERRRFYAFVDE